MAFVLEPTAEVLIHCQDYNGARSSVRFFVVNTDADPAAGGPAALAAAVQGISADAVTSVETLLHSVDPLPGSPTDGPYSRGADKGLFEFGSTDGSIVKMQIGAPNETHLEPDHLRYSVSDIAVLALETAMKSFGKTAEGAAITHFQTGYRRRPSRRKGK